MTEGSKSRAVRLRESRLFWACFSCLICSIPFLVVEYLPITDLPQHLAQVRLLEDALGNPDSLYRIQWWTPYGLVYGMLWFFSTLLPPLGAARASALGVGLLSIGAIHFLAARFGRPVTAAVFASVFIFNHVLYWGLLNFQIGWVMFVLWLVWVQRTPSQKQPAKILVGSVVLSLLLFVSHLLWLAMAVAWTVVWTLLHRKQWVMGALRLSATIPALGLAVWWRQTSVAGTGFASSPLWQAPWSRLRPVMWVESILGGLVTPFEAVPIVVAALWIGVALLRRQEPLQRALLVAGLIMVSCFVLLPSRYTNTVFFNSRWMPYATILFLLAVPPLPWRRLVTAGVGVVMASFLTVTTIAWMAFDRIEMRGMTEALAALPDNPRVLGLDYARYSRWIDGHPFLQAYAYCQVIRGGEVNFSFAEFPTSLVVYREPRQFSWTPNLEWYPNQVQPSDLAHFDFVLSNDVGSLEENLRAADLLAPKTDTAPWRLFEVLSAGR